MTVRDRAPNRCVALVTGRDPARRVGGLESYVVAHALAAARAGYTPHIFALGRRSGVERTDFGVLHRVATPFSPIRPLAATVHQPLLTRAIVRFLATVPGPHIVHGFGPWASTAARACRALARRGIVSVPVASAYSTQVHESRGKLDGIGCQYGRRLQLVYRVELRWAELVTNATERHGYGAAQVVLVNYDSVRQLLIDAFGENLRIRRAAYAPTFALRDGDGPADMSVAPELAALRPPEAPLIVSVSRHDPRKGLDVLLHALALMAGDVVEFRACLVGPGILLAHHRRMVHELGLSDRIAVPGRVADVLPYLRAADVFVLPSLEEGSGSVSVLEAALTRTAIVSSRVDGMPEDLKHGVDALLVDPGDPLELAATLSRLVADGGLRARLGEGARAMYEQRFSGDAFVADIGRVYTELGVPPG